MSRYFGRSLPAARADPLPAATASAAARRHEHPEPGHRFGRLDRVDFARTFCDVGIVKSRSIVPSVLR
jgi:hypothetical protein